MKISYWLVFTSELRISKGLGSLLSQGRLVVVMAG